MSAFWSSSTIRGAEVVLGGFLIHLVLGTLYCWGNLTSYVTSWLRIYDPTLTYNDTIVAYGCQCGGQALFMYVGGRLALRIGPRLVCLLGGGLICACVLLTPLVRSRLTLCLVYGVGFGFGIGLCYSVPIACGYKYFPNHKGLVSGIVVGGFGLGAFLFNEIATSIVNPHDLPLDLEYDGDKYFSPGEVTDNVPKMFLYLGAMYSCLIVLGSMLLRDPLPASKEELHETVEDPASPTRPPPAGASQLLHTDDREPLLPHKAGIAITPAQLIRLPQAWHLSFTLSLAAVAGLITLGTYKKFGLDSGLGDDHFMGYVVGSMSSLGNASGRVVWGVASDKLGAFRTLMVLSLVLASLLATWHLSAVPLHSKWAFAVWVSGISFCHGGNFAIFPSVTALLFGTEHVAQNFGLVFLTYGMLSLMGIALIPRLSSDFEEISYILATVPVLAFFSIVSLHRCYPPPAQETKEEKGESSQVN